MSLSNLILIFVTSGLSLALLYQVIVSVSQYIAAPTFMESLLIDQKDAKIPDVSLCLDKNLVRTRA